MAGQSFLDSSAGTPGVDLKDSLPPEYCEIVDRYRGELIAQARKILNSDEDAEDVVQETFCEAFKQPEKLSQAESMAAWLRSINRCNALNRLRDKKRDSSRIILKKQEIPERTFTTGGFSVMELRDTVDRALMHLPRNLREVVVLRYYEHLSYREISDKLKIPSGTVGSLLFDATQELYKTLKSHLDNGGQPQITHPINSEDETRQF